MGMHTYHGMLKQSKAKLTHVSEDVDRSKTWPEWGAKRNSIFF